MIYFGIILNLEGRQIFVPSDILSYNLPEVNIYVHHSIQCNTYSFRSYYLYKIFSIVSAENQSNYSFVYKIGSAKVVPKVQCIGEKACAVYVRSTLHYKSHDYKYVCSVEDYFLFILLIAQK